MYKKPKLISSKDLTSDLKRINEEEQKSNLIRSAKGNLELSKRAIEMCNFDNALFYIDRALEIEPDNPELISFRAKVFIFMKNYKDTLEQVEYLLQINPKDEDALGAREILNKILNYEKLVTAFPLYS